MPKSIFFPQLLLKNSQLENLEKLKLKFSTNMKIFDLFFFFALKTKNKVPLWNTDMLQKEAVL